MDPSRQQEVKLETDTQAPQITRDSQTTLLQAWIYVPLGIFTILAICFGTDRLFHLGSLPFPASVAVLIVLFLALLVSERVFGEHRTRKVVALIEIPVRSFTAA